MADIDIKSLISKAKPSAPSKFIVMGDPMTGKTTLASKAPRPLFISTDGNAAKAGLDAIEASGLDVVRAAVEYFVEDKEHDTLVIDTVEGIADLFEEAIIRNWNSANPPDAQVTSLADVAYGKLTSQFNKRLSNFADTLLSLPKNVVILSYTKQRSDDLTGSIVLDSELKGIRQFTKFADGVILTTYDGEKHRAHVVHKRTVVAGEVVYGDIETFLRSAGWELPVKKTKLGSTKK